MTTVARLPLANRSVSQLNTNDAPAASPGMSKIIPPASTSTTLMKRPRSPELRCLPVKVPATKRAKSNSQEESQVEKDRRRVDRDAMKEVFRVKYTKAFPSWTFYFDTTDSEKENLASRVLQLNAVRVLIYRISLSFNHRHDIESGEVLLQRGHALHHESCRSCC